MLFFYLQWDNLATGKYLLFIKFELMVLVIFYAYNSNISLNIYAIYLTQMSAADKINPYSLIAYDFDTCYWTFGVMKSSRNLMG